MRRCPHTHAEQCILKTKRGVPLDWSRGDGPLAGVVLEQTEACLAVYRKDPSRIVQDANNELRIAEGG